MKSRGTKISTIRLPATTREHYLTGKAALNIPSPSGSGDWHFCETFVGQDPSIYPVAGVTTISTNDIFGDSGIYDSAPVFRARGYSSSSPVYAADHFRAVADKIVTLLKNGYPLTSVINLDDWFAGEEEFSRIRDYLAKAKPHLTPAQQNTLSTWAEAAGMRLEKFSANLPSPTRRNECR